jgi:uncharacterized protein (UPF0303 family)
MVMKSDAGVKPRAMVIEPLNTFITLDAMTRSTRSNDFTIRAKRSTVEYFKKSHEICSFFFNVAGVSIRDNRV